jgi:tryptophanase
MASRSWAEPWRIKVVESLRMTTRAEREAAIDRAGYNTFLLEAHMDVVAESVIAINDIRDDVTGLEPVYEPEYLRFFQARFEPAKRRASSIAHESRFRSLSLVGA